ncbi:MAG TPA: hypothetical protein VKU01_17755 [Bryobacteraceae bacterium]|nr:hypothetical protein [Bryobacteraceae bacterium]
MMTCREFSYEVMDYARADVRPPAELEAHLAVCAQCRERWEIEHALTNSLMDMREAFAMERAPGDVRESILREFSRRHRTLATPAPFVKWGLIAAMLLAGFFSFQMWRMRSQAPRNADSPSVLASDIELLGLQDEGGFVAIPYAPPLAPGEFVRVVRTQLQPVALARMGVDVGDVYGDEITADLVVGQDDMPRAVRLPETAVNF